MSRLPRSLVVAVALLLWLTSLALLWPAQGQLLNWDEVDYANAARLGAWANAMEAGSLSPAEFARFSLAKLAEEAPELPPSYDEARDPLLLRHYHPPFVVYLLSVFSSSPDERVVRSVQGLGSLALTLAILLCYRALGTSWRWTGLLVVSVLALWMATQLFGSLSFHGWQAVWTTAGATLVSVWLARSGAGWVSLALWAVLALSLLTLETGLLVWATAVLLVGVYRRGQGRNGGERLPMRRILLLAVVPPLLGVLAWPGSLLQASVVKIPALYLYRAWLGDEYGGVPGQTLELITSLLPLLIPVILALVWLCISHRAEARCWAPVVIVCAVYGLVLARFAIQAQYLLPALAPLVGLVGVAVDRFAPTWPRTLLVLCGVLVLLTTMPREYDDSFDREQRADLDWLAQALSGREALADGGHIYSYYLGPAHAIQPVTVSYDGAALLSRERGAYQELEPADVAGKMVVIRNGRERFLGGEAEAHLLGGCARIPRPTITLFDCATPA